MIEFSHTEDQIIEYIARLMHAEVRSDDSTYFFTVQTSDTKKEFPFARHTLQNILASIVTKDLSDGTGLYSDTSFEIIVYEEKPISSF